jgi:hypothetical protein
MMPDLKQPGPQPAGAIDIPIRNDEKSLLIHFHGCQVL